MIKILVILTDTNIGGAGRAVLELLRRIDRRRFEVHVALPKRAKLLPHITAMGYPIYETKHCADRSFSLPAVAEYTRIIKELSPDIVHTHAALSGRIAAALCGVEGRVSTRHCAFDAPACLVGFPIKVVNKALSSALSTKIIAVCEAAASVLEMTGVSREKITVIPNGVSPMPFLSERSRAGFRASVGIGETDFVGLVSARLEPCKGHRTLIDAARILRERNAECRLRLIFLGEGSEEDDLRKYAAETSVGDMIIFAGFHEDMAPWYNIADAVLNSSSSEALSLSICEGMSLGRPIIATDAGGNTEAVIHKNNGIIVPCGAPAAFADALEGLMNNAELYGKLSEGAYRRYKSEYTAEIMAKRTMQLYESILK